MYDLGTIICSPDQHRRASTLSSSRKRVWENTFADVLLKPGTVKGAPEKALEGTLLLIFYRHLDMLFYTKCFGDETVEMGLLGMSRTELQE